MSTTNIVLVTDALRLLGVVAATDNASAEDAALALRVCNEMLDDWSSRNIDVGWFPQTTLADDAPVNDDAINAVKYSLALLLAPYFGLEPAPSIIASATRHYTRLLRISIIEQMTETTMTHIPRGERGGFYDITTD